MRGSPILSAKEEMPSHLRPARPTKILAQFSCVKICLRVILALEFYSKIFESRNKLSHNK